MEKSADSWIPVTVKQSLGEKVAAKKGLYLLSNAGVIWCFKTQCIKNIYLQVDGGEKVSAWDYILLGKEYWGDSKTELKLPLVQPKAYPVGGDFWLI